jgi:hypothetical protein
LINDNFYILKEFFIRTIQSANILKFPNNITDKIKKELFYDIVSSILSSIYSKNFNRTKEEILSKKKCTIRDQNYIARIIYKYYTDPKIPSDVMCNIIAKAYSSYKSYFSLREKGIKAKSPKFLPKNSHFMLPFFKRSFKEVIMKNGKEIKDRLKKN